MDQRDIEDALSPTPAAERVLLVGKVTGALPSRPLSPDAVPQEWYRLNRDCRTLPLTPRTRPDPVEHELLNTRELATLMRVSKSTVSGWARAGLVPFVTTPTGHRRFTRATVLKLLEERTSPAR